MISAAPDPDLVRWLWYDVGSTGARSNDGRKRYHAIRRAKDENYDTHKNVACACGGM